MAFQIIGSIRHGLETFTGVLPENHPIPAARLADFVEAGLIEEVEIIRKKRPAPKNIARLGKFDLDPDGLAGMNIERLNMLVAERGVPDKFSDPHQAIKFLSRHFNPARKAALPKPKRQVMVFEDEPTQPIEETPEISPEMVADAREEPQEDIMLAAVDVDQDAPLEPVTAIAAPSDPVMDFVAALKEGVKKE